MSFVENWVETDPDGSIITVSVLDDWIRKTKVATRERMEGDAALNLTGLIEAGTWTTGPVPKVGSARAWAVTAANLGTVPLQDGRMAFTTDTNRFYHMKGSGYVEIAYAALTGATFTGAIGGTTGNFSGALTAASFSGPIVAPAGTLTGATLAANVVNSSLTSVGTLATLTVTATITGSVSGSSGSCTGNAATATTATTTSGNAATATKLVTPRAINGVNFDGSAAITVTAAAGTLTGTSLAAGITGSSLTSVGILGATTFSNLITAQGGIQVTGAVANDGGIWKDAVGGLLIRAVAGSVNDFDLQTPAGGAHIFRVPTGTTNVVFAGATLTGIIAATIGTVTGNVTGSSGSCTGNAATATTAGTVTTAAQGTITSLGTLTSLTVNGTIAITGGGQLTGVPKNALGNALGAQLTLGKVSTVAPPVANAAQVAWLKITGDDAVVYFVPAFN